jgi:hypothetical protein
MKAARPRGRKAAMSLRRRSDRPPAICLIRPIRQTPPTQRVSAVSGRAAKMLERRYVGIELDAKYHTIAEQRLAQSDAGAQAAV